MPESTPSAILKSVSSPSVKLILDRPLKVGLISSQVFPLPDKLITKSELPFIW
jgi:hypothetical protein